MIWSLIKIFIFVAMAALIALVLGWILETPGEVVISFAGLEWYLSPIGFILALGALVLCSVLLWWVLGLIEAVLRFVLGDRTSINRYLSRNRERRGYEALSDGMLAVAAGDSRLANKKAAKAERLLERPELTALVNAQAAEASGDAQKAQTYYKAMLKDDRTRYVGIKGLMKQELEKGETGKALALARKAFALKPQNTALLGTLFDLQSREQDWVGARQTLHATVNAKLLPRDVGNRRDAVLSLADARAAEAAGNIEARNKAALLAVKQSPTLVPAAEIAARVHLESGNKRKARNTLIRAWGTNPHPDLAAAYALVEPDETAEQRRKRFEALTAAAPDHIESQLLKTELCLAAEDFPAARKALGNLAETEPSTRTLALMAAIERGQGAPEKVVRGWLAKAMEASRGPQWVCETCNHVHANWTPICDNCGAFDTLVWKTPDTEMTGRTEQTAALPLILGAADEDEEPEIEIVTDAEDVSGEETPSGERA